MTIASSVLAKRTAAVPSFIHSAVMWCKWGEGIEITGSGVSQWDDQSGNGNHLKQGTDLDRPQKQVDGSILFDGIRQFLKADAFTFEQPETVILLMKQVTWTANDRIFDGGFTNQGAFYQLVSTPKVFIFAGVEAVNVSFTLDTYAVLSIIFNEASSSIQVNNETVNSGNAGTADMGGFHLGSNATPGNYSHIQVMELCAFSTALDAQKIKQMIGYLGLLGNTL